MGASNEEHMLSIGDSLIIGFVFALAFALVFLALVLAIVT